MLIGPLFNKFWTTNQKRSRLSKRDLSVMYFQERVTQSTFGKRDQLWFSKPLSLKETQNVWLDHSSWPKKPNFDHLLFDPIKNISGLFYVSMKSLNFWRRKDSLTKHWKKIVFSESALRDTLFSLNKLANLKGKVHLSWFFMSIFVIWIILILRLRWDWLKIKKEDKKNIYSEK